MYICPKCGVEKGTKQFMGPFCIDCHRFKIEIPNKIEINRCKNCGKIKISGKWHSFSEKKLADYVKGKIKGEFSQAEFFQNENKMLFTIEGLEAKIEKKINFNLLRDLCQSCSKKAGGYFEAIIQLRGDIKRIEKYARIFLEMLEEKGTFISKQISGKDGLDLYVGNTKILFALITDLGLTYKLSTTLAGQKQGKRLYRTTFSIRL